MRIGLAGHARADLGTQLPESRNVALPAENVTEIGRHGPTRDAVCVGLNDGNAVVDGQYETIDEVQLFRLGERESGRFHGLSESWRKRLLIRA